VLFEIGGQRFGLPAADVQELVRAAAIVPLPSAPAIVEGIVNLRGRVVPVLDIRARFRLPPKPLEPSDHFVIARVAGRLLALRVDRALELVHLTPADLEDARSGIPGAEYVTWVAKLPFDLVLIHDLRTFLSRAEFTLLEEALASEDVKA
jgi:purine-binding chemotaxis protein CheW